MYQEQDFRKEYGVAYGQVNAARYGRLCQMAACLSAMTEGQYLLPRHVKTAFANGMVKPLSSGEVANISVAAMNATIARNFRGAPQFAVELFGVIGGNPRFRQVDRSTAINFIHDIGRKWWLAGAFEGAVKSLVNLAGRTPNDSCADMALNKIFGIAASHHGANARRALEIVQENMPSDTLKPLSERINTRILGL